MATPALSQSRLFNLHDLKSDPALTAQIIRLANDAFLRSQIDAPDKWMIESPRFPTLESYYAMLAGNSVVALIFDQGLEFQAANHAVSEKSQKTPGKVIACAAAVPWKGGWSKEGAGIEQGWEIKAVCVDEDARYLKKGLAVQLTNFLEEHLVQEAKVHTTDIGVGTAIEHGTSGCLTLWIQAAECLNGDYWRRRGYHEIRRKTEGQGVWGCRTSFELVVLRKDVEYEVSV